MSELTSFTIESLNHQIRSTVLRVLYHSFNSSQRQVSVRGTVGEIPAIPLTGEGISVSN
jgi:hypothetical protein